jgi:hypothetical protein
MLANLTSSAYFLIFSNLLILFMVMFKSWNLGEILTLYWAESAIIGFFNIFKIILADKPLQKELNKVNIDQKSNIFIWTAKIFTALFFTFHFGMFMFVHGLFVFGLILGGFNKGGSGFYTDFGYYMFQIRWGLLALFTSHCFSFFKNFIIEGERHNTTIEEAMTGPYTRIVVMHITILGGGFLMLAIGTNISFLIIFIIMKILFDLKGHIKERKRFGGIPK